MKKDICKISHPNKNEIVLDHHKTFQSDKSRALWETASFVKSGIEKRQLAALLVGLGGVGKGRN